MRLNSLILPHIFQVLFFAGAIPMNGIHLPTMPFYPTPQTAHLLPNTPAELVLKLEYNTPLKLPQNHAAIEQKTTQVNSNLNIQNLSTTFSASVFISPPPDSSSNGIYHLPPNNPTPLNFVHNWNGSQLKVANISGEAALLQVTLF